MALPTSGQLSLRDIQIELGAASTNISLGAMSDTAGFLAPDKVSDFYGYSNLTAFYTSITQPKPVFACDIALINTYYHNGSGLLPVVGDTVYQSNQTTLDASINRGMSTSSSGTSFQVYTTNGSGVVTAVLNCIN
jgi:hypothetical protein